MRKFDNFWYEENQWDFAIVSCTVGNSMLFWVIIAYLNKENYRMCLQCPDKIGQQYLYQEILIFVPLNFDKNRTHE